MQVIAALVIGILVGLLIGRLIFYPKISGDLRVDDSVDVDEYYLFLELQENVESLIKKKVVSFRVKFENYLSQD